MLTAKYNYCPNKCKYPDVQIFGKLTNLICEDCLFLYTKRKQLHPGLCNIMEASLNFEIQVIIKNLKFM
jgi:hypothetical protein